MKKKKIPIKKALNHAMDAKSIGKLYMGQRKKRAHIYVRARYTGNTKVANKMRKSVWDETTIQRNLGNKVGNWRKSMKTASKLGKKKK